jgi:hypothetical protein
MPTLGPVDAFQVPSRDIGIEIASREVAALVQQLEATLTPQQRTQLHMIRLAAESLGAVRAAQVPGRRPLELAAEIARN